MLSMNKDLSFPKITNKTPMENLTTTFHPKHFLEEHGPPCIDRVCIICEKRVSSDESNCFYCRVCDFYFHKDCQITLMESNYLTIDRPETHEHTLTFIRKMNSFNCDACGRIDQDKMNMYACLPCNFFIHRNCIYFPKVIKLTRHPHRLFHTFHVPDGNTKCRLCYESFVSGCGGYICTDKTCDYRLHSYCGTDKDTWDGRDLEGEPEETSNSDVTSLKEVDGKMLRHFSHHHDLTRRLCVMNGEEKEEDGRRICQACILPVDSDSFLSCEECDFALHDTCASLPRKMEHMFHRHSLILEVDMIEEGFFRCSKCERESCGFMYRCCQEECEFKIDVKCASVADDPLCRSSGRHSLTLLSLTGGICGKCYLYVNPKGTFLPLLVKCKYDIHPLSLRISESTSRLWLHCEACEIKIKPDCSDYQDFYFCFDCDTTIHVECAIGKYPFLKAGHAIKLNGFEIEIASNSLTTRPICHACHSICQDRLVFKNKSDAVSFCSINCINLSS